MATSTHPKARLQWQNWAGNQQCSPASIDYPETEEQLAQIVREAAAAGQRVKVPGTGHSFTAIALTDGRLVSMDRYQKVLSADRQTGRVIVQAGIKLHRLNAALDRLGLAMRNLGDIDRQSIAGAVSTSTHGTARDLGGIATDIAGLRLIAGDGTIIDCSEEVEPDLFKAARVGLGALGVISTVTLQCVPAFALHAVEAPRSVDDLLADLDEHIASNDHFEFFWVPGTKWAIAKFNNRTDEPPKGRGAWRQFRDDILFSNVAFGIMCRAGRVRPSLIPRIAKALPAAGATEYVDRSHAVFGSPRHIRFYEMEYAIPFEAATEAFNRVREYIRRSGLILSFPVELRFTTGDDIPLSTASGRRSAYIAVHVYQHTHYQQYFEAVEDIMDDYGGRPHWGKLHFQTAETLAPRYPMWDDFQAARRRLDPDGRFANAYLDRVIGPIGSA
ncbi:MAG: D-arabinono-1,4-lactone oxidase [Dehalococcoidia bacterium]